MRIVASIGTRPIYESEVREAVTNEWANWRLPKPAGRSRGDAQEELRKIIDRELVIDELTATLQEQVAVGLGSARAAGKEAEQRLWSLEGSAFRRTRCSRKPFRLRADHVGIRRQIERGSDAGVSAEKMIPHGQDRAD